MKPDKYYSKLGASLEPGIITTVVLGAFELAKQGKKIISLTGGSYDVPSLPVKQVKEIFNDAPTAAYNEMLQYGSTSGMSQLRNELNKFMSEHNIKTDPGRIIVTTGSQEAIDLVTRVFINKGDNIIVGAPTYLQALSAFKTAYPRFIDISIDPSGMDTQKLEKKLRALKVRDKQVKMLYLIPSFQNPDSSMMTMERRKHIIELAESYDFLIFEDNPYGYISFEGPMPTPLAGLDKSGRVIYTSTFSKIVSPGMRIGWLTAHPDFCTKMIEVKGSISICNDGLSQYAAAELFRRGDVAKQIPLVTRVYRKKRDVMLESMETSFPRKAKWETPKGGLFIWVKFPKTLNTDTHLAEAMRRGVGYIPGSVFFTKPEYTHIRLNYSLPSEPDIVEGIGILGRIFKEKLG